MADQNDPKRERPEIERVREWGHGPGGFGKDCDKYNTPVHTAPSSAPGGECGGLRDGNIYNGICKNDEWISKGVIERDKKSGEILTRDGKKAPTAYVGDGRDGRDKPNYPNKPICGVSL